MRFILPVSLALVITVATVPMKAGQSATGQAQVTFMHNRGKAECLEAIYPTGRVETLSCARFRFNWHLNYVYSDDAAPLLPAGTVLHAIMWHDNTAANPFNPDPDAQITYGQRTIDEMSSAWISWYYMSDEDFRKETEARRAPRTILTSSR